MMQHLHNTNKIAATIAAIFKALYTYLLKPRNTTLSLDNTL